MAPRIDSPTRKQSHGSFSSARAGPPGTGTKREQGAEAYLAECLGCLLRREGVQEGAALRKIAPRDPGSQPTGARWSSRAVARSRSAVPAAFRNVVLADRLLASKHRWFAHCPAGEVRVDVDNAAPLDDDQVSSCDVDGLLVCGRAAVSDGRCAPYAACVKERQESRRTSRQRLPLCEDAALRRRRRAGSAPALARFTPAASTRAAVSAPSTRQRVTVRSDRGLAVTSGRCCWFSG